MTGSRAALPLWRGRRYLKNVARPEDNKKDADMSMRTILLIIVVLLLIGALPTWPYSAGWGYYPSGGLGLVLIVLLVVVLHVVRLIV